MNTLHHVRMRLYPVMVHTMNLHGVDADLGFLDRALDAEARLLLLGKATYPPMTPQQAMAAIEGIIWRQGYLQPREALAGWFSKATGIKTPGAIKKVEDKSKKIAKDIDDKFTKPYVKGAVNVMTLGTSRRFEKADEYKELEEKWRGRYNDSVKAGKPDQDAYKKWKRYEALHKKNIAGAQSHAVKAAGAAATVVTAGAAAAGTSTASAAATAAGKQVITDKAISAAGEKVSGEVVKLALRKDIKEAEKEAKKARQAQQSLQQAQASAATPATSAPPAPSIPLVPIGLLAFLLS